MVLDTAAETTQVLDTAAPMNLPMKVELPKGRDSVTSLGLDNEKLKLPDECTDNPEVTLTLEQEHEKLRAENARLLEQVQTQKQVQMVQEQSWQSYYTMGMPWSEPWTPTSGGTSPISPEVGSSYGYAPIDAYSSAPFTGPTSVMMRNIPNNYTRSMVLELLHEEGFFGTFDFFYLPIDLKKKSGLGYAFINFVDHQNAALFCHHFSGFSCWIATSGKICQVTWSDRIQGLEAHVERYRNSAIMHDSVPEEYKPMIFGHGGVPLTFPPPTKHVPSPQER